jgi:hypothetical protein
VATSVFTATPRRRNLALSIINLPLLFGQDKTPRESYR